MAVNRRYYGDPRLFVCSGRLRLVAASASVLCVIARGLDPGVSLPFAEPSGGHGVAGPATLLAAAGETPAPPIFEAETIPAALQADFRKKSYSLETHSGNYLAPKVLGKTLKEKMVPVPIDGKYVKDLRGRTVFLRGSVRDKLLAADAALFAKKREHIQINYGFRSNALQHELYLRLNGKAKVAHAGGSFHETGMALDIQNWRSAQRYLIEAGFVGGCYGIEEDVVHYSIGEITKASNGEAFQRCTLKEVPEYIVKGFKEVGDIDGMKKVGTAGVGGIKKLGGMMGIGRKKD